jgi:hypothetical protein
LQRILFFFSTEISKQMIVMMKFLAEFPLLLWGEKKDKIKLRNSCQILDVIHW